MPDARGDHKLNLVVAGRAWHGWESARIRRGIEHCSGGFELALSNLWQGLSKPAVAKVGDRCELMIGDDTVITGWVDMVEATLDATTHQVQVSGRDAAGDLVDCSAIRKSGQWRGVRIEQLAAELAQPYGVTVRADVPTGKPLASFALQEGETVFNAIERAARIRALLLVSDGKGGLVLTRASEGKPVARLETGLNLHAITVRDDWRDRHSTYIFKGQAPGSDWYNAAAAAHVLAKVSDPAVTRHRPLVVVSDTPDVAATLRERVQWEANVRAARSLRVDAEVVGWRDHRGDLWRPNTSVHVVAPALGIDESLLVSAVESTLDERGTKTKLELVRAGAFTLLPMKEQKVGGPWYTNDRKGPAK